MWVKEGDKNKRFFHAKTTKRINNNRISCVLDSEGNMITDTEKIVKIFQNYFEELYTTERARDVEEVLSKVERKVSDEDNAEPEREITKEEIFAALHQMNLHKAPEADGMNALFYQRYWQIVNKDVCDFVFDFFRNFKLPKDINHTNIVLISKVKGPQTPKDYRPISLCNVAYKVIAKVLANRLKYILTKVICPNQGAFVPGRQIFNYSMVVYELVLAMKDQRQGKNSSFALKLAMTKAYD